MKFSKSYNPKKARRVSYYSKKTAAARREQLYNDIGRALINGADPAEINAMTAAYNVSINPIKK